MVLSVHEDPLSLVLADHIAGLEQPATSVSDSGGAIALDGADEAWVVAPREVALQPRLVLGKWSPRTVAPALSIDLGPAATTKSTALAFDNKSNAYVIRATADGVELALPRSRVAQRAIARERVRVIARGLVGERLLDRALLRVRQHLAVVHRERARQPRGLLRRR